MSRYTPSPPVPLPPARTVQVAGRGEFFLRDSGVADPAAGTGAASGDGSEGRPVVMLLHGWFASADLNWFGAYDALIGAGYRVLAIDHRGHGRGLRPLVPFRLVDCAADAAAVLRELDATPALVVGYSMGGAIAQLVARDHADVCAGLVLSGTAQHWQDPQLRNTWRAMGLVSISLSVAPRPVLRGAFGRLRIPADDRSAWLMSEITRHSARDIAEAGRELGRFDSRPWLGTVEVPAAVVVTSRDEAVPPRKQHELARALGAQVFQAPIRHLEITTRAAAYNPALLQALAAVTPSTVTT